MSMKPFIAFLFVCVLLNSQLVYGQPAAIDKVQFFKEEKPVKVTLETYWTKIINQKNKVGQVFPARFKAAINDSTNADEPVDLQVRGHFRRDYCYVPPLKLGFYKSGSSVMHPLKSLKLVSACRLIDSYEQYLFKEFLVYKMYNLLTEKSFRVRLLLVDYKDSNERKGTFTEHAFLTEDLKDLAKRNQCKESDKVKVNTESTDRNQMTMVAIFEYMIGNTDWSVPAGHNIKLIQSKEDSLSKPFSVPYDFDYSGIVNTEYAIPDPLLNTETVLQRVYRGYPRTMDELNAVLEVFKQQKEKMYALINNFEMLSSRNKKNMLEYLDSFYDIIKKLKDVKSVFIDNARFD